MLLFSHIHTMTDLSAFVRSVPLRDHYQLLFKQKLMLYFLLNTHLLVFTLVNSFVLTRTVLQVEVAADTYRLILCIRFSVFLTTFLVKKEEKKTEQLPNYFIVNTKYNSLIAIKQKMITLTISAEQLTVVFACYQTNNSNKLSILKHYYCKV